MTSTRYTPGYGQDYVRALQRRSAATHAQFLTPLLQSGMSLIDSGCGPGSITLDLAELIAPGRVLGVDIDAEQVELATGAAADRSVTNAEFQVGDACDIPVEDGAFEVGFVHAVLLHLADPVAALRELARVLIPGGMVAICHSAGGPLGGTICHPPNPALERDIELYAELKARNGCAANIGPRQRQLLLEAGFQRVSASAHCFCEGTTEAVAAYAEMRAKRIAEDSELGRQYLEHGLATPAQLRSLQQQWLDWGAAPGAFLAVPSVAAVGWKPDTT